MPREKAEKSQAAKNFENAKAAYDKAAAAIEKQDNAATRKAIDQASDVLQNTRNVLARENFERVGGGRVAKAIAAINNVGKVAKPRVYSYSDSDVSKMENALNSTVSNVIAAFRAAKGGTKEKTKAGFTF